MTRLTDTSLIAHWLTEDHGLIKTVAKGALRPKSPFRGKLDLFFGAEITFTQARRGELHTLREISVETWRMGLRESYVSTLLASYFCQLLEAVLEPEHPDPEIHDLLRRALDHVDTAGGSLRALRHFEAELSRMLGVSDGKRTPENSLREMLGRLPASRDELMDRLS